MFLKPVRTFAGLVTVDDLNLGRIYPAFSRIRAVSLVNATAVAEEAFGASLARHPRPASLEDDIEGRRFTPEYRSCV